jgi:hypothetical protein
MRREEGEKGDCCMKDFIEIHIVSAVREILMGQVNELLGEMEEQIPLIEFSGYEGNEVVVPAVTLAGYERTEKERLILLDSYNLTIGFSIAEKPERELYCYAYTAAVEKAFRENQTLDGIVDRVVLTGKKYGREVILSFRITVEEIQDAGTRR